MCRAGVNGRRCPSHTNPQSILERNEVRREQYAHKVLRDKTAAMLDDNNVTFDRGDTVNNTYFQGNENYDANKFEAVKDPEISSIYSEMSLDPSFFPSKPDGGLWTSPGIKDENGSVKTAWTDFTHYEGFRVSNNPLVPLKVKQQAIVVRIDSEDDLTKLHTLFPGPLGTFSYESMAQAGIDGVRLSQAGLRIAKSRIPGNKLSAFGAWDIDSTVWINNTNLSVGKSVSKGFYEPNEWDTNDDYEDSETSDDVSSESTIDIENLAARYQSGELTLDDFDFGSFGDG